MFFTNENPLQVYFEKKKKTLQKNNGFCSTSCDWLERTKILQKYL